MLNHSNATSLMGQNSTRAFSIAFTSIVILIGAIGNFMNLYFIYKTSLLHSYNNILIGHLAITDFLHVTLTLPMAIGNSFLRSNTPLAMCRAFAFILNFLTMISLATTAAISIDRCLAVIYPYRYSAHMKIRYIIIFIISTWLLMAVIAGIPLFGLQRYGLGEYSFIANGLQCWFDFRNHDKNSVVFAITLIYILLAISATMISYIFIFIIACHKGIADVSIVGYSSLKRSIRTTALIVGSNIICFMPVLVAASISYFSQHNLPAQLTVAAYLFSFCNSAINPVIYASTNAILRCKIKQSWLGYCCCNYRRFHKIIFHQNSKVSQTLVTSQASHIELK